MFLAYRSMNPLQQFQIKPVNLEISLNLINLSQTRWHCC